MSIFESPTAIAARSDAVAAEQDESFAPRSIQIAGVFTAALVALGLVVSNVAEADPEPRPAVTSRVAPGAAAVEQAEDAAPVAPVPAGQSVAPAPAAEAPEAEPDETDPPTWQESQPTGDTVDGSDDRKRDGHPGKGHGRWKD